LDATGPAVDPIIVMLIGSAIYQEMPSDQALAPFEKDVN
jgi:hypothetical protein